MRFKIDWASLITGSKFTVLLCFTLYLRTIFQVQAPGGLYLEGRFNGGFFALRVLGGQNLERLIHGGAYFRNFTVVRQRMIACQFVSSLVLPNIN